MLTKLKEKFRLWITKEAKMVHQIGLTQSQIGAAGIVFIEIALIKIGKALGSG